MIQGMADPALDAELLGSGGGGGIPPNWWACKADGLKPW